ncbi:MAG: type II secretion system F family protein [Kiritimatiellae bacterium]|nr:type II secretion system F family protein [Kiritimatiellia bacterium]
MSKSEIKIRGAKKIAKNEVIPFTRQLASMLGAGMTILASIQTLEEQCANQEFKKVLQHLGDVIEGGEPLSAGLTDFPVLFDEMYVNMVIAGEQSGEFAPIMKRLAQIMTSASRLRKKVKSAMTYPTVIVSIALCLAGGLIQFVVPVFAEMFSGFGKPLPMLTQKLVDISNFVKSWWYIIVPCVIVAVWLFRKWKKTERGRLKFDEWMLKLPVFGILNQKSAIGRFCRLLSQMVAAGVPILKSLKVVAGSLGNCVLEKSILAARLEVEQGNQISPSLEGKPYIPVLMVRMLAAGEKAGKVEDMLDSVADAYDEEVETMLGTLTSLMEPFLMVFLGAIIGTIVLAMFLPIFNLGSLAS